MAWIKLYKIIIACFIIIVVFGIILLKTDILPHKNVAFPSNNSALNATSAKINETPPQAMTSILKNLTNPSKSVNSSFTVENGHIGLAVTHSGGGNVIYFGNTTNENGTGKVMVGGCFSSDNVTITEEGCKELLEALENTRSNHD